MSARLDRAHVTRASRIMLPTYAFVYVFVGITLLLQDPARTDGPTFALVIQAVPEGLLLEPIYGWGALFLTVGMLEMTAMFLQHRWMYQCCLTIGAGVAAFWAVLLLGGAFAAGPDMSGSYTSGIWILGMAVAQIASARSLGRDA